jgi:hypothetical protein
MVQPVVIRVIVNKLYDIFHAIRSKLRRTPMAADTDPFAFIVVDMSSNGISTHMMRIDMEKII